MAKKILQIESTTNKKFRDEILTGVEHIFKKFKKDQDNPEQLLDREATAKLLSISLVTLWRLTKNGSIPAFRVGSAVRYKKSDVLNAIKQMNNFEK